ncbi:Metallo-hydrolase/oxidoreductase [Punctularia strigosozonata HHB-11173 SS5]|uniref:Metallo-hydrolase/oxidoreductase n=1 Tax=Punctularia strigosozonata (strain HHB-11173) TaxID=741275 RepID=UPI0004417725|nr:Metallo-hydrolase/oxidoreductase [Punctularia strigosozonata HHB-11173 SS5]EIN08081.1 Metallo-hydrolase/oxidoreductase [Punctularia strigosozonata HHB-11173 SS5]
MPLPPAAEDQSFWHVSALEAGTLHLPLELVIAGAQETIVVPALSFLLRHSSTGRTVVFDLGVRRDFENLPPKTVERVHKFFCPSVPQTVTESLAIGGLQASDVDYVIYSHLHWDHIGDPGPFTNSTFIVGEDAHEMCDPGYPQDPHAMVASDLLPRERTRFEPRKDWTSLGPFPLAHDLFGDGSAYLVDAQGHCPGHINLLARTSTDGGWIYLAGDSAHDRRLLTGEAQEATEVSDDGVVRALMHRNMELAESHMRRIVALLSEESRVRMILAHDKDWWEINRGGEAYWPGKIPSL